MTMKPQRVTGWLCRACSAFCTSEVLAAAHCRCSLCKDGAIGSLPSGKRACKRHIALFMLDVYESKLQGLRNEKAGFLLRHNQQLQEMLATMADYRRRAKKTSSSE